MKRLFLAVLLLFVLSDAVDARQAARKVRPDTRAKTQMDSEKEAPCQSYIVMEASTGKILEGQNIDTKWPPASVAKLMLAAVVAEKLKRGDIKLTDRITVSRQASKMGGSQVFLKEGEVFTLDELMKAVLVASGNDAAFSVAEYIAGSADACVALINEKAKSLEMLNSEFRSVHGLPPSEGDPEDLTSCKDLALLARALLAYPQVLAWTSIRTEGFRDGSFIMNNHNKLMYRMSDMDGMKTGYYRKAGFNLVATAKRGDLRFIVVAMGSPTAKVRDAFVEEKLKKHFSQYTMLSVVKKGDPVDKEVLLPDGKLRSVKGVAGGAFSYPVPHAKKNALKKEIHLPEKIPGAVKAGQKLGELILTFEQETVGKVDIVSPEDIPEASFFTKMLRKVGLGT
ncbi:MAG: D-alanyl-D-alanine carboxypeptidase [Desulfobacteraceae bacterium]|nr:MAG: D-alanyl-D-alanine carboxypeptidase [Desulfobacteraceae bacterium]